MPRLEISLLGSPQIKLDGTLIDNLPAKGQALLIYLAVTKQQYAREYLAELLWSDESMPLQRKLNNLRGSGALLTLNRVLGDFLIVHRYSLAFKGESEHWLDVDAFEAYLRQPNPTVQQLQTAVNLYHSDFLTGQTLRDAEGFEDWAQKYRQRLRQLALNALYLLAVHYKQQRQYTAGIEGVARLLSLEPYFEEAHREMMLLLALTGQVSEACAHYEKYWDLLDAEGLEPEGETQALYQKLRRGDIPPDATQPLPPPPLPSGPPPFQTPPQIRHFVGRHNMLAHLVAELQKDNANMVQALVGMGGVGKSTLAVEIAHAAQEHFVDGVLWASVAASEPTAVLESWAQAYGYDFSRLTDLESIANAFRGLLAEKRVLLVLDNVMSVSRIRPLLPNGSACRVLLTTRDQDLAYALDAQVWLLAELSPANGRRLLAHLLGEKRVEAEPEAATDICGLLQHLPLAVEIIGQRLKSRPRRKLADIAHRLRDEKQRLSELTISDREVRASFGISYATLDANLRHVFALMGVFNGRSFTANVLADVAAQDRYEVEDSIFALTTLSLAQEDGDTRYKQHPLLADFAREKLAETGEEEAVHGRLAHTYLALAQQYQHDYDALRPEWDNLMSAMQTAYDHKLWPTVMQFANVLHDAWFARARFTEARIGYQWASNAALALRDMASLARYLLHRGRSCIEQNHYDEAHHLLLKSLEHGITLNDQAMLADVKYELARVYIEQSDFAQAQQLLNEVLQIREKLEDPTGIAAARYRQARMLHHQGSYSDAEQLAHRALSMQQRGKDRLGALRTLRLLAGIAIARHENAAARTYCQQALELSEALQDKGEMAATFYRLSMVWRRLGNFTLAQTYAERGLALFQLMGDKKFEGLALYSLSIIYEDLQAYDHALTLGLRSLDILRQVNDKFDQVYILLHLGDLYTRLQRNEVAHEAWQEGLALAEWPKHPALAAFQERLAKQV